MPKKTHVRKPPRPVKSATPVVIEERVRRENPTAVAAVGKVAEALPTAMFTVGLDNGDAGLGPPGGKMRKHDIRVLPGDRVVVAKSPYNLTRGRITFRHR